ncbi:MAG: hypothetical protein JSW58_03960 [Candidatus Latescibacterota bacterium]|nr:MAG: hypothetical protein JSW58_03960 [Candidatus Latescibacterota bacterium]
MHRIFIRVRIAALSVIAATVCVSTFAGCAVHLEGMSGEATIEDVRQENGWFFLEKLWVRIEVYPQWTRSYSKILGVKIEEKTHVPDRLLVKFSVDQRVNELDVDFSKFDIIMPCRGSISPKTVELEGDLGAYNRGERPTVGRDIRAFRGITSRVRKPFWFRLEYVLPSCYDVADSLTMDLAGFVADGVTVDSHVATIKKSPHSEVRED